MEKLTYKELEGLWGDDLPYSEVELIEQQRILDDKYARKFLQIKFYINPTTYRLCKKNIDKMENELVLIIFDRAKYKNGYGYEGIIHAQQYANEDNLKEVLIIKKQVEEAIFYMHKFVIDNFLK